MNEKLVSWFEELIPEIKKSGSVKDTMLKFANKKNLAPALLEKLGHVYNTAKTVTYLDKCASESKKRAESFNVLDVSDMLNSYTKTASDTEQFSDNDFASFDAGGFTDLFKQELNFEDLENLDKPEDYQEIKLASDQRDIWNKESIGVTTDGQAQQIIFDTNEDNRKLASEISDFVRDSYNETSFEELEQDAKYYFGDCVKQACDYVSDYMQGIKFSVKRAADSGKKRLIVDTTFLMKFAMVQNNLNLKAQAENFRKEAITSLPHIQQQNKPQPKKKQTKKQKNPVNKAPKQTAAEKFKSEKAKIEDANRVNADLFTGSEGADSSIDDITSFVNKGDDKVKGFLSGTADAVGEIGKAVPQTLGINSNLPTTLRDAGNQAKKFLDLISPGRQDDQEFIDRELDEAKYSALIQDLVMTDPILSEEDEDKILDLYNTIKSVAPELAKDKNVVRVVLRQGAQYDGIAAPDLAQLVEAERNIQKSKWNSNVVGSEKYDTNPNERRQVG